MALRGRFWPVLNCAWQSNSGADDTDSRFGSGWKLGRNSKPCMRSPPTALSIRTIRFPSRLTAQPAFKHVASAIRCCPQASCIANDVELNREAPFYIVSGSNMSGKSTLLRAIGINAVLAFAGAPVRASALRLSGLSIFASVSVVDSLLHGKSKFLAEVERLRQAIQCAIPNQPVLFLVDEIFGGTNSRDRRIAAEAVIRTLVNQGAIGALSTHDLALTEIASQAGMHGVNVHMGSRDRSDPMDFDYRLKPGVTTESNALAIARLAGVPV